MARDPCAGVGLVRTLLHILQAGPEALGILGLQGAGILKKAYRLRELSRQREILEQ
jgi:hypothetical protein